MPERNEQIAIDGPAASGKSTVAQRVATALGGIYVSTGEMYRALTCRVMQQGIDPEQDSDALAALLEGLDLEHRVSAAGALLLYLDGAPAPASEMRSAPVTALVSQVARVAAVRQWLIGRQRACRELGLVVMEGRDIGTVVFPEANYKFYLTASVEERARRRLAQEGEALEGETLAAVAAQIAARDQLDSTRKVAPLRAAEDAVKIDATELSVEQVVGRIVDAVRQRRG